jgi:hypothetical protein
MSFEKKKNDKEKSKILQEYLAKLKKFSFAIAATIVIQSLIFGG